MRLATIFERDSRDGRLVVVSADGLRAAPAPVRTLIEALRSWEAAERELRAVAQALEKGAAANPLNLSDAKLLAPLPNAPALLDGSAFIQHVILARKARGAAPPEDLQTVPLMYQGKSDKLFGPRDPIRIIDPAFGYDFEGEFAVVTGEVAAGVSADAAASCVRLLLLMNDISLRMIIAREAPTGFGFVQGKPGAAFAPFAVTPDELGDSFRNGRIELPLMVRRNEKEIGRANGKEMHFSFFELIAHAARTRDLSAGTIIGGGTVSNADESTGSSCITEQRMLEQLKAGKPSTPFLSAGEKVEMEARSGSTSIFGLLRQECVGAQL